jgi:hypothetical protein
MKITRIEAGHKEKITIKDPSGGYRTFEDPILYEAELTEEDQGNIDKITANMRHRAALIIWTLWHNMGIISTQEYEALKKTMYQNPSKLPPKVQEVREPREWPVSEVQEQTGDNPSTPPNVPQTATQPSTATQSNARPTWMTEPMEKLLWNAHKFAPEAVNAMLYSFGLPNYDELRNRNYLNMTVKHFDAIVQSPMVKTALEANR